jgi:hypothetical protein
MTVYRLKRRDVRFWIKADIAGFWLETGCPLMTQSGQTLMRGAGICGNRDLHIGNETREAPF